MEKLVTNNIDIFKILKNKYVKDLFIFMLCWLFYGIIANIWVQFPDSDWYNYQYYNAWAFLNDRIGTDFLAANYRSYFNPYINVMQYLTLLKLNNFPRLFLFLSAIDGAFILFLIYKIGNFIFSFKKKNLFIFLSVVYVALSPIMFEVMDFSRYDGYVAAFELWALYLLLKNVFDEDSRHRTCMVVLAGGVVAVATTIKLTGVVFCLSIFLSLLLMYKKITRPIKTLGLFAISTIVSFLLLDGYWLYVLYAHFKNPFFPYFNDFLASQYYDKISVFEKDFIHYHPKSFLQYVFYPFFKSNDFVCFGCDDRFWDSRYAISFVSMFVLAIFSLCKKISMNKYYVLIFIFVLISYYINLVLFGNYRFIMCVSALFGIVLIYSLFAIFENINVSKLSIFAVLIVTALVYVNQDLGYKHFLPNNHAKIQKVLSVENLNVKDNSYVFSTFSTSVFIPNQNKQAKYMGYELSGDVFSKRRKDLSEDTDLWFNAFYLHSKYLENEIRNRLNEPQSNVYIMFNSRIWRDHLPIYKESLNSYSDNRSLKNCRKVSAKLFDNVYDNLVTYFCEYN